jgi:ribonuclease D
MRLAPYQLVKQPEQWRACVHALRGVSRFAIDLEANSMFAYRERVCLIQLSIPGQDYIVDPLAPLQLEPLGDLLADPEIEKVFHAAEYDLILLKREFGWKLNNLFDTMWAARILGYAHYGLASLLEQFFSITLDKRYQKSDWCRRPLTDAQLSYAQHDTHHLFRLRDRLAEELLQAGCLEEAEETFGQVSRVQVSENGFEADSFWSINGVQSLSGQQQAILKELNIYRDKEARRRDQPLFKIFNDRTLLELARTSPANGHELAQVEGMTRAQIRRYGETLLRIIKEAKLAPPPSYRARSRRDQRPSEAVVARYEKLHDWRKQRAQLRGVESDVIVSRESLWEICAGSNPWGPGGEPLTGQRSSPC